MGRTGRIGGTGRNDGKGKRLLPFRPFLPLLPLLAAAATPVDDWPVYGHDPGGTRYSPLSDIARTNVTGLRVAWTFRAGDVSAGSPAQRRGGFEATPIVSGGTMYLS